MCEAAGIEDYQLMDMVDQGVSGLDESRPYAIVLNGNYASLAPYYGPVFEKAVKEANQGQLRRFTVDPEHFTAENVWLPCVPINIDSTGSATRSSDDKPVGLKKARRTVGGGSPETMPEYSGNQHAEKRLEASGYFEVRSNDRLQWRAARLKRVATEQQRLYALCGYIDDSHMAAVGRKRAFRLLVTFVSVSMRIGAVCAPDKFNFGQRLRELGFIEDVKQFVVILPDDKQARLISVVGSANASAEGALFH